MGEGAGVSTAAVSIFPRSRSASVSLRPSTSMASRRQFSMVSLVRGWSGRLTGPPRLSWHITWSGNTAPRRSSARMRWIIMGTFLPRLNRSTASARLAFQRQRLVNMGVARAAWVRSCSTVAGRR